MAPGWISSGTVAASAASVVNPTVLSPGLPATRSNDDWLFCFTSSAAFSATVATPAGWQALWNSTSPSSIGRLMCFACKVTGSETAPTISWTGVSTGTSGHASLARIMNLGNGFTEDFSAALVLDDVGGVSESLSSSTVQAGGDSIAPTINDTFVIAQGVRISATVTTVTDTGGSPVTWAQLLSDTTTSGSDLAQFVSVGVGPTTAGTPVTDHTWTLTGGAATSSSGIMVGLQVAGVDDVPEIQYTRGG